MAPCNLCISRLIPAMATKLLRCTAKTVVPFGLSRPAGIKASASVDANDNKKTRHKLKKFLTRRPTLQAVRDKGYIKGEPLLAAPALHTDMLVVLDFLSVNPPRCGVSRPGVWLQPVQPVSAGERHRAHFRQDVHRPRGEQRYLILHS